ncbi:MAG: hypothetical protein WDO16_18755 [Bacteroidota bacterium]
MIQALIELQEITGDRRWLLEARELTEHVIANFSEVETGFFYYTKTGQTDVIIRKKEVYDGAVPSGNAVMAYSLYQLSVLFDKPEWRERTLQMLSALGLAVCRHPSSFGSGPV